MSLELLLWSSRAEKLDTISQEKHGIEIKQPWTLVSALLLSRNGMCDKVQKFSKLHFSMCPTSETDVWHNYKKFLALKCYDLYLVFLRSLLKVTSSIWVNVMSKTLQGN